MLYHTLRIICHASFITHHSFRIISSCALVHCSPIILINFANHSSLYHSSNKSAQLISLLVLFYFIKTKRENKNHLQKNYNIIFKKEEQTNITILQQTFCKYNKSKNNSPIYCGTTYWPVL